jgi:DNA-binding NarL/FixJ family response regulator
MISVAHAAFPGATVRATDLASALISASSMAGLDVLLLLLDLGLPDSQGLDGLLRFRADFSRAKVVIVSSQDTPKPTAVNLRKIGTASQTTELLWREVQL